MSQGICDGCGTFGAMTLGVCSMCEADGVPPRQTKAERQAEARRNERPLCGGPPDNFGTTSRARDRALAIRAEDPTGWDEALGSAGPLS